MEQIDKIEIYKGLFYEIPKQPPKSSIDNHKLPQKQQKWKRVEQPENFDILPPAEKDVFINKIDDYCTYGYWFYNNGIPTYITGDHFHYLNEFKLDVGFPDYRDADRRWFYHWDICEKDDECFGQIYGKKRRDGYTYRALSIILNHARKTFNANYGIMSKTGTDAKECFLKLKYAVEQYVDYLKPQEKTSSETKIVFDKPVQRITSKTLKQEKKIALNTTISWRNTKENSFDSMAIKRILCDEPGKWEEANLEIWYSKARKFLSKGMNITGKILCGSSVNESKKGGDKFEKIWWNSDFTNKTANGRTVTGMYKYFVPAYDGYEGCIDEYGMSVIETPEKPIMGIDGVLIKKGAKQYLEDESAAFKSAGDMVGYYEHKREYPFKEEDMFISPANKSTGWDIDKIHQQIEHNNIVVIRDELYSGYFQYVNGDRESGFVEYITAPSHDSPLVKHRFSWLPKPEDRNRYIIKNRKKAPANTHIGLFTLDPYAAVNTVDNRQSNAASHGFKKFDMMSPKHESYVFIGEYCNRLKDPLLVYEDMIMQCYYFGWALLGERNIKNCNDYFRNRDMQNYLLQPPSMTEQEFRDKMHKKEDAGLANTVGKTQNQLVEHLASYITNHIGYNDKTGEMGYMPFTNTMKDWLKFEIDNWTPYDLTISSMLAVVGANAVTSLRKKEFTPIQLYEVFNNNGIMSERIVKP